MTDYITVILHGVEVRTTIEEIAECLEEVNRVIIEETAENSDISCVFKALNYLKKYRSRDERIVKIVKKVEEIIRKDLEQGRLQIW